MERRAAEVNEDVRIDYDRTAGPLKAIQNGSHVLVQDPATKDWAKRGVVVESLKNRDYLIKMRSGRILRRNRRFFRPSQMMMNDVSSDPQSCASYPSASRDSIPNALCDSHSHSSASRDFTPSAACDPLPKYSN